jgi:hypothetical protein
MNIKKPLLVAGIATGVTLASLTGVGVVSAATSTTTTGDGQSSLITKIATKFGLKEADVKAVFDEDRTAHQAERQAQVEKELTQLVTDGKITADQKTLILNKAKEVQAAREANRDTMMSKTDAERKAAMDAEKTALEQWAKDNGISTDYLKYVGGFAGHRGGPGGFGHGMHDSYKLPLAFKQPLARVAAFYWRCRKNFIQESRLRSNMERLSGTVVLTFI